MSEPSFLLPAIKPRGPKTDFFYDSLGDGRPFPIASYTGIIYKRNVKLSVS